MILLKMQKVGSQFENNSNIYNKMSQTAFFGNQAENQKKADMERIRINNTLKPSIDIKKGFPIGDLFYLLKYYI